MKKILLAWLLIFLTSCWEQTNQNKESWSISKNQKSVKEICDWINKWDDFEKVKKEFWEPKLVIEQSDLSSYSYWDINEICSLLIEEGKVLEKTYVKA